MGNVKENKWFIAFKENPGFINLSGLTIIEPEPETYEADPFLIKKEGKTYLFFELYNYEKGVIACREIFSDGSYSKPVVVLNTTTHISFPALFEENGEVYMTPEEGLSGKLNIYVAKNFPCDWQLLTTVSEGRYADPILFKDGEYYYIYATEADNVLKIFRSKSLYGPWDIDYKGGEDMRNAGHIFPYGGEMVRPVQECHQRYGRAILFQRMSDLKTIKTIEPNWHPDLTGTHTINFTDDLLVIDGRVPYDSKIHST